MSIAKLGKVSVFTASVKRYADPIIDEIDPKNIIKRRFYREVNDLILLIINRIVILIKKEILLKLWIKLLVIGKI